MQVTVTGYNKIPYLGSVQIVRPSILRGDSVQTLARVADSDLPWTDPDRVLTQSWSDPLFYQVNDRERIALTRTGQTLMIAPF